MSQRSVIARTAALLCVLVGASACSERTTIADLEERLQETFRLALTTAVFLLFSIP